MQAKTTSPTQPGLMCCGASAWPCAQGLAWQLTRMPLPPVPPHPRSNFKAQHEECVQQHTALAVVLDATAELLLAPVTSVDGGWCVSSQGWAELWSPRGPGACSARGPCGARGRVCARALGQGQGQGHAHAPFKHGARGRVCARALRQGHAYAPLLGCKCKRKATTAAPRPPRTQRTLLPPPPHAEGGATQPVFWGYVLPPGLASLTLGLLERSQLPLIFDLDETLVVAHTASTMLLRRQLCLKNRWGGRGVGGASLPPPACLTPPHLHPHARASCAWQLACTASLGPG